MAIYWNRTMETLPDEELRVLQEQKLRRQSEYVWLNSEFYRRKWTEAGLKDPAGAGLKDLPSFPLTTKAELRDSLLAKPPLGLHQAAPDISVIRIHSSSGTTGRPTYMGVTRHDVAIWTEGIARVLWAVGMRPEDVYGHGLPMGNYVGGIPIQDAVETIGSTFFIASAGGTAQLISSIRALRVTAICSTPSYVLRLTDYVQKELQEDPHTLGLRLMVLGCEPGTLLYRDQLESAWGCKVVELSGNSDIMPLFYAECPERDGMHLLSRDLIYAEVLDPVTKKPLPWEPAVEGDIIYTHLDRECSPLVRFDSNDHIRIVGTGRCGCGRTSPRIQIIGRYDDMLIVGGLNVFPSAIQDLLQQSAPDLTTGQFRILLSEPGPLVRGRLRIAVEYSRPDTPPDEAQRVGSILTGRIKTHLGFTPEIQMLPWGSLERSEFKTRYIEYTQEGVHENE